MLELKDIKKSYTVGDTVTEALKGISINFRKNEFVAVLGPSGCGKTTLLNIIGGLDKYDSGDLTINGRSTKEYVDSDWDFYRNRRIGFVFQSYNLIPHQTVLANVELALTLAGTDEKTRKEKALDALKKVGIGEQAKKKPNQLSGGQMQRVAIARALVNDPDILLADEPTGALDTATSIQIMDILKEISKEKLVVMVTHNPDLAEGYATRTVKLLDGSILSDSDEYVPETKEKPAAGKKKKYKTSMSYLTAISLSLNNLLTKKARTFLTSFAGSIGIIGIALILSLSSGFKGYINKVQEDTLSTYPITIENTTVDAAGLLQELSDNGSVKYEHDLDKIYSRPVFGKLINTMMSEIETNDLKSFKDYIDSHRDELDTYLTDIKYSYGVKMNIYARNENGGIVQVNPMEIFSNMTGMGTGAMTSASSNNDVWAELIDNRELLDSQYEIIDGGRWPESYDEAVLFVNERNEISDYILCALGITDQKDALKVINEAANGIKVDDEVRSFTYEDIHGITFSLLPSAMLYEYDEEEHIWENKSNDSAFMKKAFDNGVQIKIVGIMRPKESAVATSADNTIGYTHALTEYCIEMANGSDIVKTQKSEETDEFASAKYGYEVKFNEVDVFTGIPFDFDGEVKKLTMDDVKAYIATLPEEQQQQMNMIFANMSEEEILAMFNERFEGNSETTRATYENNLILLGAAELDTPTSINFYAKDFESKDKLVEFINDYNKKAEDNGEDEKIIRYTDIVGIMMNSVSTIIDVISYVLIAFVAISLVVSSIMIGIITYISVLERTKEIGVLRAIGASKHDISNVFNAETLIVGFVSGMFGIIITMLLNIPINMVINYFADIQNVASLPWKGAVALVVISMILSIVAGLIPSRIAAKKDPVVALRTE